MKKRSIKSNTLSVIHLFKFNIRSLILNKVKKEKKNENNK